MTYYRRRSLTDGEWAFTGAIGAAVGALAFYLVRIWLQREPLAEGPSRWPESGLDVTEGEEQTQGADLPSS